MPNIFVQREITERATRARFPPMRRSLAEAVDQNLTELRFLDPLLALSLPAHHHEVGGAWYLFDLVLWVLELGIEPSKEGSPPSVVCEHNENEEAERAEKSDG